MRKLMYITSAFLAAVISSCHKDTSTINDSASFPSKFKFLDLNLKVLTSIINTNKKTTAVLYGNDLAFNKATAHDSLRAAGEQYVLVTWSQQANPDWFGSKIPYQLLSVDVVKILSADGTNAKTEHKRYVGKNLSPSKDTLGQAEITKYILEQKPAIVPNI
jgi:hypothetical protein